MTTAGRCPEPACRRPYVLTATGHIRYHNVDGRRDAPECPGSGQLPRPWTDGDAPAPDTDRLPALRDEYDRTGRIPSGGIVWLISQVTALRDLLTQLETAHDQTRAAAYRDAADLIEHVQHDQDDAAAEHHGALTDAETTAHITTHRRARLLRATANEIHPA